MPSQRGRRGTTSTHPRTKPSRKARHEVSNGAVRGNDHATVIRSLRLLVAVLLLLVGGLAMALPANAAPAQIEKDDYSVLLFGFQTCNGDFVATRGTRHTVTKRGADGLTTMRYTYNGTGTGQPSGAPYTIVINEKFTFPGAEFSDHFRMRAISKGGEQNLLVSYRFRNGQVELDDTKCVG